MSLTDLKEMDVSTNNGTSAVGPKRSPIPVCPITASSEDNPTDDTDGVGLNAAMRSTGSGIRSAGSTVTRGIDSVEVMRGNAPRVSAQARNQDVLP
jgi:hypothetical protein